MGSRLEEIIETYPFIKLDIYDNVYKHKVKFAKYSPVNYNLYLKIYLNEYTLSIGDSNGVYQSSIQFKVFDNEKDLDHFLQELLIELD